jgi:glycosyltransferase involved in cell wall biosynthesis
LNAGLDVAGGDFVALCGSDDEFAPSRLARQLKVVEPDDDVIVTGSLMWQPNVNPVPDPLVDATARDLILHRFGVSMFPHLYHRVVFEAHRFDPNLRSWGDWDVMLRVLRDGVRFVDCGDAVGVVHEDGGGRLTSSLSMAESLEYLLSKYAADIAAERGCRAEWEFRIGRRFALAGEVKSGLRWIRRSLRHDPLQRRRIGYALRLAKNRTPPPWDPYP